MNFGNGLTQATEVEPRLQPCQINLNSSGSILSGCGVTPPNGTAQDFHYVFGSWGTTNNGDVTEWVGSGNQNFDRLFTYDSLNRLSTLNQSGGNSTNCSSTFSLSWSYDAWGNRTDQNVTSGTCNAFHARVNSQNQLSGSPYQYDAAGNMTNDGNHTYFYDAENRLIQVDGTLGTCSTATACYTYDAFGRRVRKAGTGVSLTTDYAYDLSGNVISEFAPACSGGTVECLTVGYLYLGGSPIAEYKNSTTYFVHSDHLGSTRLVTDLNQNVVQNLDYLPFGEILSSDSGTTTHKFTGDERDSETNLDHTWFRQYSSQLGRWMHPDPAGLAAVDPSNPQSWNRYAYVVNNPMNLIDPAGLQCLPSGRLGPGAGACPDNGDNPYPGGGGGGCSLDGCGNGLGDPGCYLNGSPVGCNTLGPLLSNPSGATAICPNADCNLLKQGPDGQFYDVTAEVIFSILFARPSECDDNSCYGTAFTDLTWHDWIGTPVDNTNSGFVSPYLDPIQFTDSTLRVYKDPYTYKSIAQTMATQLTGLACGKSPGDRIVRAAKFGAVRGVIRGAAVGFTGGEFMGGIGGIPGAGLGAFMGGTFGAAGGVASGTIVAVGCSLGGAYGQ